MQSLVYELRRPGYPFIFGELVELRSAAHLLPGSRSVALCLLDCDTFAPRETDAYRLFKVCFVVELTGLIPVVTLETKC